MENALVEYNHIKKVVKISYNLTSYYVKFSIYGEVVQDFLKGYGHLVNLYVLKSLESLG